VYYIQNVKSGEVLVKSRDSADFYRVVLPPDTSVDKTLLGINEFYKNGKKKMVGSAIIINRQLLLSGSCIEFYENGKRKSIVNYVDGVPSGDFSQYFPNGVLYITGEHGPNGNMSVKESRDSTGNITASDGTGRLIKYTRGFKKIIEEGPIANGIEEGEWHGSINEDTVSIYNYKNSIYQNGKTFNKAGQEYPSNLFFEQPSFPGGEEAFRKFLGINIRYPAVAKENHVQGKVFVSFIVERDGSLSNIRVERGAGSGLDDESMRVINLSPKWIPGNRGGIPLRMEYVIPISYSLEVINH
jgi:TonB family protein